MSFVTTAAVIGAGTSIYSAVQSSKAANNAVNSQQQIAANLQYQPIDIAKLRSDATQQAIDNATQSLALERSLQPNVAATRDTLSKQISSDLALGGNLSPDIANKVSSEARTIGSRSGAGDAGSAPLTASLLGLSAIDVLNQRRAAASNLLAANPLPAAGLDPGSLASAEVAQNAAQNQFNLAKAGVSSNLANSEATARSAQIGGQTGMISSLTNLIGKGIGSLSGTTNYGDLLKKTTNTTGLGLGQTPSFLSGASAFPGP